MNENNKAINIIINKILSITDDKIKNLKFDKTFQSTVWAINEDGTYVISYKGQTYNVPTALPIKLTLGQKVQVSIPSGILRNMYISGAPGATAIATDNSGNDSGTSSHTHSNKTVLDGITSALISAWNSAVTHISDTVKHITNSERELWNTVSNKAENIHTHNEYLTEHQDLSDYAKKSELPSTEEFVTENTLSNILDDYTKISEMDCVSVSAFGCSGDGQTDNTETLQVVSNDDSIFKNLTKESVIKVIGEIRKRNEETFNEKIHTGEIELLVSELEVLGKSKHELPFEINFGLNYFPKKEFKGITYKEGYYESVVITLGEGLGDNWWCVLFPPLCMLEVEESVTNDVEYTTLVKTIIDKYF